MTPGHTLYNFGRGLLAHLDNPLSLIARCLVAEKMFKELMHINAYSLYDHLSPTLILKLWTLGLCEFYNFGRGLLANPDKPPTLTARLMDVEKTIFKEIMHHYSL